ncbi:uncharacterized protein LOC112680335 isoform X2 [Sipha flava]|nr:uncharacterized protein LOC112680335 isoform X2 [Sipha flava]
MSQSKTGSPKGSKSPDDNSKSDGVSTPPKSVRSPSSTKSSPSSNKSLSLAERLAQSTRGKSNPTLKSPVSKSSPASPNASTSKIAISKESPDCLKSEDTEKINMYNGSVEMKIENSQFSDEQSITIVENRTNELNEGKHDIDKESNETETKENGLSNVKENIAQNDLNEFIVNEDLESLIKPQCIENSAILELKSKKEVRQKIWEFMEENSLVVFPKPCYNRIPNFKGCNITSQLLEKLEEFKKAKTVQVTPDKAQETARFLTLTWGKRLLVPLLRLKEGLLQNVSLPFAEPSAKLLRSASTQKGLRKWGNKLTTLDKNNDSHHIDMIILGSVAVDRKGHRIGIGNGFCDLEFVILRSINMVTDKTVIVTIVHEVQVFDILPTEIFKPYDVPVDIIITSNEIIRVENRLDRPKDIFWNYISKRRLLEMPPLQLLRAKQEKDNEFDCTLKDVDSEPEEIPPSPKTYKKTKKYRHKRSYSTRSDTNDSVFKDSIVSKYHSSSKNSSVPTSKNSDLQSKRNRAKSTSSQQQRSTSSDKHAKQNDKKEHRSSFKKPNKRRTKSESAKTAVSPVAETESKNSNNTQEDSPSSDTPKNKRRSRQKHISSDIEKESIHQSRSKSNGSTKHISRSNSRATRRDYIDRPDYGRDMSVGCNTRKEYYPSSKNYYLKNHHSSYSQDRSSHSYIRSSSRNQRYDSNRSTGMQLNRYPSAAIPVRQTRYFNGSKVHHNNFNGPVLHQNNSNNHHVIRHNSYSNDSMSHQNNYYGGIISRRNSYSKGSAIRQDNYTNSRVFRPPHYRNGIESQTDEREYVRESRPRFNNNRPGYFNSNEKPSYSRSISDDEFILKVGNIANNVRVRDLKAALMERGVKPLHITWRGPRGFAYLRYSNAVDMNKENIMGSLQNVRIKPNGIETAQTQTLIVTECQFS